MFVTLLSCNHFLTVGLKAVFFSKMCAFAIFHRRNMKHRLWIRNSCECASEMRLPQSGMQSFQKSFMFLQQNVGCSLITVAVLKEFLP